MSASKPTAGYPSRTAAVLAMRAAGMKPREIACICRISVRSVAALEHSARRRKGRPIRLDLAVLTALAEPARRRGLYPEQLAARIVATVAAEGMIDAVLDDDGDIPNRDTRAVMGESHP